MLIACESCDQLYTPVPVGRHYHAACARCGQRLYGNPVDSLNLTLALSIAALVLLVIANLLPFMTVSLEGQVQENHIVTGVISLAQSGFAPLAALILLTTVIAPLLEVVLRIWAIAPVIVGWKVPGVAAAARLSSRMSVWSMLEVYLLAVIVGGVKLAMMATVSLDVGAYAFFGLILLLTAARFILEPEALWSGIESTQ